MGKKILIISPTPTHPTNAGNRIRILNMASFLISRGHEVHFLYSRQEKADESAMKKFWGGHFYAIDYQKPQKTVTEKIIKKLKQSLDTNYIYYSKVDEHYNTFLDKTVLNLQKKFRFDVVLVEYIFQSRTFLNLDEEVLKVIDTHDVMTDRHKLFLKEGKKPVWYSVPYLQEKKGIKRADVVIAIQEKEKEHFKRMTGKTVVNIGHLVRIKKPVSDIPRKKLLFVGSNNPSNLYGINDFLADYFPGIRNTFPGIELMIAGNICNQMKQVPDGVILLGGLDDISNAYDLSDIVINPLTIGTGLKIKMIEAMGYSKVVLSTPFGADGLEEDAGKGFLLYRNKHELFEMLNLVFSDHAKYKEVCRQTAEIAGNWNRKNGQGLLEIFSDSDEIDRSQDFTDDFVLDGKQNAERLHEILQKNPEIQKFVIISVPRSGSNLLVGLLDGHSEILCYPELFHPMAIFDGGAHKKAGMQLYDIGKRNDDPINFLEYIFSLRFGKDPKAAGFKIFPKHNDSLMELMIKDSSIKKILLIRENILMNFISHKTSFETKVFFVEAGTKISEEEEIRIKIDFDEFLQYEKSIKSFFSKIKYMLIQNEQLFCELHFEDILKQELQEELLKFLQVTATIDSLKIISEKQNKLPLEQKVINFGELRDLLIQSGRAAYLNKESI